MLVTIAVVAGGLAARTYGYGVFPTPEADAQFARDGAVSPFWNNWPWAVYQLTPRDNCWPEYCNFSGVTDASISLKAAGTTRGLYLMVTVVDDVWDRSTSSCNNWKADHVVIYIDPHSASGMSYATDGPYNSNFSYYSKSFQVAMVSSNAECCYFRYDDNLWAWLTFSGTCNQLASSWGILCGCGQHQRNHEGRRVLHSLG